MLYAAFTWLADKSRERKLLLLIKKVRALLLQTWIEDRNKERSEMQLMSFKNELPESNSMDKLIYCLK